MTTRMRCCCLVIIGCAVLWTAGCHHDQSKPHELDTVPDTRTPIQLPISVDRAHRDVMMQHLETVQVLVGALADGDYELAKGVTEAHLGFFARRHTVVQHAPPAYVEMAIAHVQATKDLAAVMPSKDIKQILPRLNRLLKTCMACHLEYKVGGPVFR